MKKTNLVVVVVLLAIVSLIYISLKTSELSSLGIPSKGSFSIEQFSNADVPDFIVGTGTVKLVDGTFEMRVLDNSHAYIKLNRDPTSYAIGDVNRDGLNDVVATFTVKSGGTGSFTYLSVFENRDGNFKPGVDIVIGDRITLNKIIIDGEFIIADIITQGEGEPMCCGTLRQLVKLKYTSSSSKLAMVETIGFIKHGWKKYSNLQFGYSLIIPEDWTIDKEQTIFDSANKILSLVNMRSSDGEYQISLEVSEKEKLTILESLVKQDISIGKHLTSVYIFPNGYECFGNLSAKKCSSFTIPIKTERYWYYLSATGNADTYSGLYRSVFESFVFPANRTQNVTKHTTEQETQKNSVDTSKFKSRESSESTNFSSSVLNFFEGYESVTYDFDYSKKDFQIESDDNHYLTFRDQNRSVVAVLKVIFNGAAGFTPMDYWNERLKKVCGNCRQIVSSLSVDGVEEILTFADGRTTFVVFRKDAWLFVVEINSNESKIYQILSTLNISTTEMRSEVPIVAAYINGLTGMVDVSATTTMRLSWLSPTASNCTVISDPRNEIFSGTWSNHLKNSGSLILDVPTTKTKYTIQCFNVKGGSAPSSVQAVVEK